jgi:hypothetical protein
MPRRHEVQFNAPRNTSLGVLAVMFEVKVNGEDLGDLRIWRGGVDWKPTNGHHRHRLSWQ